MPEKQKRTSLEKLQRAWSKASAQDRAAFARWIADRDGNAETGAIAPAEAIPQRPAAAPIASGRYLTPEARQQALSLMAGRQMDFSTLAREIGHDGEARALGRALVAGASLRLIVVDALRLWLDQALDERAP